MGLQPALQRYRNLDPIFNCYCKLLRTLLVRRHVPIALVLACGTGVQTQDFDPAARDAEVKHGAIGFERSDEISGTVYTSVERIAFSEDGRFLHRIDNTERMGKEVRYRTFVQGKGWRYIEQEIFDRVEVVFDNRNPWPRDDDAMNFLSEKPSFPIACGLRRMQALKRRKVGPKWVLSGRLPDETEVKLTFSSPDAVVPESMERSWNQKILNRWLYGGKLKASDSLWVPETSAMSIDGAVKNRKTKVRTIDLSYHPNETELITQWFRSGVTVFDRRVEPWVVWTYEELKSAAGGRPLDPIRLLALSTDRADFLKSNEARKRSADDLRSNQRPTLKNFLWIFAAVFVFLVIVLGALRLKSKANYS